MLSESQIEYRENAATLLRIKREKQLWTLVRILVVLAILSGFMLLIRSVLAHEKRHVYHGQLIEKFVVKDRAVIRFYSDSLGRNITTPLRWNDYGNMAEGDTVSVNLNAQELKY